MLVLWPIYMSITLQVLSVFSIFFHWVFQKFFHNYIRSCFLLSFCVCDARWPVPNVFTAVDTRMHSKLTQQAETAKRSGLLLAKSVFVHSNLFLKDQLRPGATDLREKMWFLLLSERSCCLRWNQHRPRQTAENISVDQGVDPTTAVF